MQETIFYLALAEAGLTVLLARAILNWLGPHRWVAATLLSGLALFVCRNRRMAVHDIAGTHRASGRRHVVRRGGATCFLCHPGLRCLGCGNNDPA